MVSTYTPTYYSSFQDSIASLCKNLLPFSFNKKKRLTAIAAAEQRLSKQQADNLKWQQESFHQILKLMGLCKEGIVPETEVSAFKSYLLDTLIASPHDHEHSTILRDKLVFLQELLYAKCVSEDEYHSLKRPLLQRLAVQGAEIDAKDVYVGAKKKETSPDEEWSVIDLKDEKARESSNSKNHSKPGSAVKQIKGAASVLGFGSSSKNAKAKEEKGLTDPGGENIRPLNRRNEVVVSTENPFWNSHNRYEEGETKSILMPESLPHEPAKIETQSDKARRKPFRNLFQKVQNDANRSNDNNNGHVAEDTLKSGKKPWGFEGFKKWKKNDSDDENLPLALNLKSNNENHSGNLVQSPVGEGPNTKEIKRKLHPDGAASDFFVDKVLGENIKKKLSQIKSELGAKNPNVHFSDDQIEAISTRLPVDKADLKMFFPKSWCDTYGDVVLDVVRKEFKDHVGEMSAGRREKNSSNRWTTFDDDENYHPNLFAPATNISIEKGFKYNPFFDV
ncbi:OLC1v1038135C1 [Oldenlandia corymbosa var. corymbosa]|uniref:OLC1v1038135C1 n=1 Tax=Oldenlandia corymbosa var. corymbosa TaxID=529605 RepID=A0AAV1D1S7_OLDCO|nr:OLC1v1038135C1 [Oldenlandia corymbosa var. corymbosa]